MGRERKTLESREAIENMNGMAENARVSEINRDSSSYELLVVTDGGGLA